MKFTETAVQGAYEVELEPKGDDRGFFARVFCEDEFRNAGLENKFCQFNNSLSRERGTLRGLHYQIAPHGEAKLVRCLRGALFDVVVDVRPSSSSFGAWHGLELTPDRRNMLFVPKGCAHGFLTLEDESEVLYFVSAPYAGASERIIRWNDPMFGIEWPIEPTVLSDKDARADNYNAAWHNPGY